MSIRQYYYITKLVPYYGTVLADTMFIDIRCIDILTERFSEDSVV